MMISGSYLQVDLSTLDSNVRQILRELDKDAKLIPVLKGNAYGLGAVELARFLSEFGEIDTFAVSHVAEGLELRRAGIDREILVMSLPLDFQLQAAEEAGLTLTLGSFRQFPILRELAHRQGRPVKVSLKLDTGLHRIGFLPEETERLCRQLRDASDVVRLCDTFSHYSETGTEKAQREEASFRSMLSDLRSAGIDPGLTHMASSASLEDGHGSGFGAVRVGRRLFFDSPVHPTGVIREVASLRTYLTDIRERKAGDTLGYNGRVTLAENTRVGVIPFGYGDGWDPSLVSVCTPVLVQGQRAPLLACCMDQSLVDLGDISCVVGDEVTLFGSDRDGRTLSGQEVAGGIGWEGCDLTARLTPRVERVYSGK